MTYIFIEKYFVALFHFYVFFQPPADTVYMTDAPPPYPGINGNQGYSNGSVGGAGGWTAPPGEDAG